MEAIETLVALWCPAGGCGPCRLRATAAVDALRALPDPVRGPVDRAWPEAADYLDEHPDRLERVARALTERVLAAAGFWNLQAALERIAAGVRPDGTYNLSRLACEQIAREALESDA